MEESKNSGLVGCLTFILILGLMFSIGKLFTDDPGVGIVGLVVIGMFFYVMIQEAKENAQERKDAFNEFEKQLPDMMREHNFTPTRTMLSIKSPLVLSIDVEKNALFHCRTWKDTSTCELINLKDVLEIEFVEDAETTIKTSRSGQIAGALIGGALAGGAGAIIGGVTSKKRQVAEVKEIKLRLIMNDIQNPIKEIYFYKGDRLSTDGEEYKKLYNTVYEWFVILDKVLKAEG